MSTEPIPSKAPGWYVADDGNGFTSDPAQAQHRQASAASSCKFDEGVATDNNAM